MADEDTRGMTYAGAGVDIMGEGKAIKGLVSALTFRREGIGAPVELGSHFTGLIDIGDRYLSLCTDGVGSKIKIAEFLQKWDTIGIDCMAMNANDMICIGAEPLAFVDYIAVDNPSESILAEVGKGLNEGARQANLSIIGGETATLPEIVNGLDLAGTCLGMVEKDRIITGNDVSEGDAIIGLPSSGLHSNGFTLVRRVIDDNDLSLIAPIQEVVSSGEWKNRTLYPEYMLEVESWVESSGPRILGDVLLEPTRIYVKEILALLNALPDGSVTGMANITGGGLRNLNRIRSDVRYLIEDPLPVPPVFRLLQVLGRIEEGEMYQTFNMGLGMVLIVRGEQSEKAVSLLEQIGGRIVGKVVEGSGVEVPDKGLVFKGYV